MRTQARKTEPLPLRDLILQVVGPILIILMIGSLVFFLIDICYRGPHAGRMRWVFGLFTIASVLVSRISIEEGTDRAALFGLALGVATLITSMTLVDFEYGQFAFLEPVVLVGFIVVVMWSANRLTWDCTLIDESRDVSAIGLTELISRRLFRSKRSDQNSRRKLDRPIESTSEESRQNKWLFLFFAGAHSKNTPGLWVFYFSIAALPIFGVGQWFANRDPDSGFFWIFLLFGIYLASGLGLLMLTSLLGLDRYLRKRGTQMPTEVMRNWIIAGSVFALLILLTVLFLPKPDLSGQLERSIAMFNSPANQPNQWAAGNDGQQAGKNPQGQRVVDDPQAAPQADGNKGEGAGKGKSDQQGSKQSGGAKSGDGKSSESNSSNEQSKQPGTESGESSTNPRTKEANRDARQPEGDSPNQDPTEDRNTRPEQRQDRAENREAGQRPQANRPQPNQAQPNRPQQRPQQAAANQPPPQTSSASGLSKFMEAGAKLLVWVLGLVVLLVILWLLKDELAALWAKLFSKKKEETESNDVSKPAIEDKRPLPGFATFKEPFSTGQASRWPSRQLIEYTFSALEAWARDRKLDRDSNQTPFEFATKLKTLDDAVSVEAKNLAEIHGRCLFGRDSIDRQELARLQRLWQLMVQLES